MNVAAAMMVMAYGRGAFGVSINAVVGPFIGLHRNVSLLVMAMRIDEGGGGPTGSVIDRVPRLRHAVQAHGRQKGDTQTDANVAKCVGQ